MKYRMIKNWLGKVVVEFKKSLDRYVPYDEFACESEQDKQTLIDWFDEAEQIGTAIVDDKEYTKWSFHYEFTPIDYGWVCQVWIVVRMTIFKIADRLISVFKKLFGGLDNIKHLLDYDVVDDGHNELLRERSKFPEWYLVGEIKG